MPDKRFRPIRHGTVAGYQRCRPSCDACRAAWRTYYQERYSPRTSPGKDPARLAALESLAARHPTEFLTLYEKTARNKKGTS